MTIRSAADIEQVSWIPTGLSKLDKILGGGIPTKRIVEVSGPFSVGKSTLALMCVAQAQKEGMPVLWADFEWSWERDYPQKLGIDLKKLDLLQTRFAETGIDLLEEWADKHENGLIVVDSVGSLLPRAEAEKGAEGKTIGGQAGLVAKFCRKLTPLLAEKNHALVVLNHEFTDIMSGRIMTSGGLKLSYAKAIWLKLRKMPKKVMQGETQVGDIIEAEIRKNKLAPTMKQTTEMTLLYGQGFSVEADRLQELLDSGEVTKEGNTYFFKGEKLGVGLSKAREALKGIK